MNLVSKHPLNALRWHEFWIGVFAGAGLGVALYEIIASIICK